MKRHSNSRWLWRHLVDFVPLKYLEWSFRSSKWSSGTVFTFTRSKWFLSQAYCRWFEFDLAYKWTQKKIQRRLWKMETQFIVCNFRFDHFLKNLWALPVNYSNLKKNILRLIKALLTDIFSIFRIESNLFSSFGRSTSFVFTFMVLLYFDRSRIYISCQWFPNTWLVGDAPLYFCIPSWRAHYLANGIRWIW